MTALLDPAQIEERERTHVKQLEHQVGFKVEPNPFIKQVIPAFLIL